MQLLISVALLGLRDGRVIDQGYLLRAAGVDMKVEGEVAGVEHTTFKPAVEAVFVLRKYFLGLVEPCYLPGLRRPEGGGVGEAGGMGRSVSRRLGGIFHETDK